MAAFPNGTQINIKANKDGRPPSRDAHLPKADQGQPWPGQGLVMASQGSRPAMARPGVDHGQPGPAMACPGLLRPALPRLKLTSRLKVKLNKPSWSWTGLDLALGMKKRNRFETHLKIQIRQKID